MVFRRRHTTSKQSPNPQALNEQEQRIQSALLELRDLTVREVMTPRVELVALEVPVTAKEVAKAVRTSGHSRFPVFENDLDHLIGILFVKDLFRSGCWSGESSESNLKPVEITKRLRKPFLVPESRKVLELLTEMRQKRVAFAVVVDEYGGVEGVLTMKDLVERLVGDLPDEFDEVESNEIESIDQSRWLVEGTCSVDKIRSELNVELPEGEYVTLGGFIFNLLGHIPKEGESTFFQGWQFRVEEMDRRRIAKVVVKAPSSHQNP